MSSINSDIKRKAEELFTAAKPNGEIAVSVDKSSLFSVRVGSIGNRENNLSLNNTLYLVHEIEQKIKASKGRCEIHWPPKVITATTFHTFKRVHFLN